MGKAVEPSFEFEEKFWSGGVEVVLGMDEVGRGSFAGPVVAGAVAFSPKMKDEVRGDNEVIIRDSKKMTSLQRKKASEWIINNCVTYGIGESGVNEINDMGIKEATFSAFRRAVGDAQVRLKKRIKHLIVDAFYIPNIRDKDIDAANDDLDELMDINANQLAIKGGDEKSISIAASSIIAKVYRDKLMVDLGKKKSFRSYEWDKNKGYGTKSHRSAILKYGITEYHRLQYVSTFLEKALK